MKARILFSVLFLVSLSVSAAAIVDDRPAFHADVVIVNHGNVTKGKHYQGPNGFRYEATHEGMGKVVVIGNYKQKLCRIYFDFNKTYIEQVLDTSNPGCDMGMNEMMASMVAGADYETLSSTEPCHGYDKKEKAGTEQVSGRMTEQWYCMDTRNGAAAVQWYEPKMRHVIKHQGGEFETEQYTNIVFKSVPDSMLAPIAGYKKTTPEEMFKDAREMMQKMMQMQKQMQQNMPPGVQLPNGIGIPQF